MVKELKSHEVTERISPIFEHISQEAGVPFASAHFFPHWRRMMDIGVARIWENDGCVLGAIFSPDVFNGNLRGLVYFWFALPEARGTGRPSALLSEFEKAAAACGCRNISISSHVAVSPEYMERMLDQKGYEASELVFSKSL
jgi:hypothetical protein